jgi:hypothetical protein
VLNLAVPGGVTPRLGRMAFEDRNRNLPMMSLCPRSAVFGALTALGALSAIACARPSTTPTPAASASAIQFAPGDSVDVDTVAPGMLHYRVKRPTGPFDVQIVTVPVGSRYELIAARALDSLFGRERVTDIVRRRQARGERIRAALNADFFDLRGGTGAVENNQVIDGEIWKGNPVTDSPFNTFRNSHSQFAVGANGRPYIDRFSYAGALEGSCGRFALDGVNTVPRVPNALVLYTSAFGSAPRRDSVHAPRELEVRASPTAGPGIGAIELTVDRRTVGAGTTVPITRARAVLGAFGTTAARLDSIARCDGALRVRHGFRPDRGSLTTMIGGWPRVVQDGRNVGGIADSLEGTFPRFSAQRHPRSAVGFDRDSSTVYLVAVQGRQETYDGMTLVELGDFMISIGAYQGMNFDGGGSTALVIDGRLANRPSDATGERAVGNALLVRERKP